ncbi:hypothetical protein [Mycobacteroides saopaulense]|uniref:hypothetical protein n=1 Tax=Mycobacteroides saopaulense TaxID=1578165 RepID=UPI001055BD4D|nr:hypothetical protein [Mycobacteroides saopaulense]
MTWGRGGTWAVIAVAVLLVGTGCAPQRTDESQQISTEIRALPGVTQTTHDYFNVFTKGQRFGVTVTVSPAATADQLAAIWELFTKRVREVGFSQHDVTLTVVAPCTTPDPSSDCSKVTSAVDADAKHQNRPPFADWVRLRQLAHIGGVDISTAYSGPAPRVTVDVAVTSSQPGRPADHRDITAAFRQIAGDFAALSDAGWHVGPASGAYPALSTEQGFPDISAVALWERLNALAPTSSRFTSRSAHKDQKDVQYSTARHYLNTTYAEVPTAAEAQLRGIALQQLELLKQFGQPGIYELHGNKTSVTVWLGGCMGEMPPSQRSSAVEAEMREKFESCPR